LKHTQNVHAYSKGLEWIGEGIKESVMGQSRVVTYQLHNNVILWLDLPMTATNTTARWLAVKPQSNDHPPNMWDSKTFQTAKATLQAI